MKASELMIGDWVSVLAHFLETSTEGTATSGGYNLCRKNCHIGGMNGDLIAINKICSDVIAYDPIPLTEEILKANAFEVCYESCYQTKFNIWSFDEKTCVEYKISKQTEDYNHLKIFIDGGERVSIPIRYVHELQHALRICGLNELADNFKVTD